MTNKTATLLQDVFSSFKKGFKYGSKGDKVTIITESIDVLIVELKNDRFPVTRDKLLITN